MSLPPAKKQKVTQKFREEYSRTWPFIQRSKIGDEYAFCDICTVDIKISSGARYDLERHIKTPKHVTRSKVQKMEPLLSCLCSTKPAIQ